MSLKLRIILDVREDVFRDIYIDSQTNLLDLHKIIAKSFGFSGSEMASFYTTDEDWNQGEEIPLENFSEESNALCMQDIKSADIFKDDDSKLIYIYDLLTMWTFFIEVLKLESSKDIELPHISLSVGVPPEKAPEKHFEAINNDFLDTDYMSSENDFEDEFNTNF